MTYFPIKDLKRADYNPRIMPDVEMQSLMSSIETHGFVEPIVVNINKERYGVIVGGHQRLTAVEKLIAKGVVVKGIQSKEITGTVASGLSGIPAFDLGIPCFEVDLTLEAEKQLNLALNKIHGKFDEDKLYTMIVEMKESPTLPTTGFREDEVSRILDRNMPEEEDEEKLVLEGEPKSIAGEIYELGEHRLICGDSTEPLVYQKLFGSIRPDMIWTDPPYNVNYEGKTEEKMTIKNDKLDPAQFKALIDAAFANSLATLKVGAPIYICTGYSSYPQFLDSMLKNGFYHSGVIIWVKNHYTHGFMDYHHKHEWIAKAEKKDAKVADGIIYGWKEGKHTFYGENEYDVWEMPRRASNRNHPTEKPDWLIMRAIRNSTKRGDIILDPFSGSGSVMSACEKTGRRAFMIELDPKYCDVIRARWDRIIKSRQENNA